MPKRFLASPELQIEQIADPVLRSNFQRLQDYFEKQNQLLNFQFLDVEFEAAEEERRVSHGLGVVPRDLLRLEMAGNGTVTFHRTMFTKDYLFISASGPARVRFLCGLYWKAEAGNPALGNEQWRASV